MSNINTYRLRVRLNNGATADITIQAISGSIARQMAESQYGAGNVLGML
jgi:hypothetical protein